MANESFDCIIIGSGPGGYVAAIRAAQLGMSVAVVEQDKIGGRCLNYACIPAKAVLRSADIVSEIREAGVVEAAAADLVLLDDGDAHSQLRGADRCDVSTRS